MMSYNLSHLKQLEAEAIHVFREVAAQFENPCILFSGGKDSIVMTHLARKAFFPAKIPFPLLHVDTGHNFPEAIEYRDNWVKELNVNLHVGYVQDSIDRGTAVEETGPNPSRNALQSVTLLESIEEKQYDALFGGGRRDEEKARAKERFFSHRNDFGEWDPRNQRPELWSLYNGKKGKVFISISKLTQYPIILDKCLWIFLDRFDRVAIWTVWADNESDISPVQ